MLDKIKNVGVLINKQKSFIWRLIVNIDSDIFGIGILE
jgi:hypothetical protein